MDGIYPWSASVVVTADHVFTAELHYTIVENVIIDHNTA